MAVLKSYSSEIYRKTRVYYYRLRSTRVSLKLLRLQYTRMDVDFLCSSPEEEENIEIYRSLLVKKKTNFKSYLVHAYAAKRITAIKINSKCVFKAASTLYSESHDRSSNSIEWFTFDRRAKVLSMWTKFAPI